MSEPTSACRWVSTTEPRVVPNRHANGCNEETCRGCQPCPEYHCRICNRAHSDGACPECLAEVRENLREVGRLCRALPEEVEHRGVEGEAMMLLGPATNPEAWGHREASARAGRISDAYLDDARDELHPLFVLGGWDMVYRDAFDHDEGDTMTLTTVVGYLDRNLTYAATWPHVPFEDMARDLRQTVGHLESVLHDGEQVDRGAPCMTCNIALQRTWGQQESGDGWICPKCRQTSTEDQYRFAVMHLHRAEATELTDREMEIRTGVRAGTVRVWAKRGLVRSRRDSGRVVYVVEDVESRIPGNEAS